MRVRLIDELGERYVAQMNGARLARKYGNGFHRHPACFKKSSRAGVRPASYLAELLDFNHRFRHFSITVGNPEDQRVAIVATVCAGNTPSLSPN
jgi:hypothetical protein